MVSGKECKGGGEGVTHVGSGSNRADKYRTMSAHFAQGAPLLCEGVASDFQKVLGRWHSGRRLGDGGRWAERWLRENIAASFIPEKEDPGIKLRLCVT